MTMLKTFGSYFSCFNEAFPLINSIGGYYEANELQALWEAVQGLEKCDLILEVGVERGRSAAAICLAAQAAGHDPVLYAIDAFCDHPNEYIKGSFLETMQGIEQLFRLAVRRSSEVDLSDWPESFDFVHIDGGHEYETVLGDALRFGRRVRKGGRMAFHDYERESLPDVARAVREWWKREGTAWRRMTTEGTTTIVEKVS